MSNSPNKLNNRVFEDDEAKKAFETILETLGYITPSFISREDFNNKNGKFLEENGDNEFGQKTYTLYLPKDLNNTDIFFIIFLLNEKFNLNLNIQKFIGYIKVLTIGLAEEEIKELKRETQNAINEIIDGNNLKKDSYDRYKKSIDGNSNMFSLRGDIRRYIEKEGKKEGYVEDNAFQEEIESSYQQELYLTFFREGMNTLRYGLMTLTKSNFEEIKKRKKEKRKGDKITTYKVIEDNLDSEEQKLRDKIGIDELKTKLTNARNSGNQVEVIRLEKEASNKIIKILRTEYPYQVTLEKYGDKPSKIVEFKELQCVGFSLVGHSFLSELGIKHNGLNIPGHSALEVFIGNKIYYFDPTNFLEIKKLKWSSKANYNGIERVYNNFEVQGFFEDDAILGDTAISGDTEKILFSQIYYNKGTTLLKKQDYAGAIEMFDKAIELNPKYADAYYNKGNALKRLGRYKEGKLYIFTYNLLNKSKLSSKIIKKGCFYYFLMAFKEEKLKIKELFNKKDFEGIRLYLLSLEVN